MKRKFIILFIFTIALIVRLAAVHNDTHTIESDEKEYDRLAVNIVEGKGYINSDDGAPTALRPPLYPAMIALLYSLFGHSYHVVRLAQVLAGSITVVVLYLTAERIFNEPTAFLTGLFASFYMPFVACTRLLYTETFFTLLMAVIILLTLVERGQRLSVIFLIGLACGLLTLLRSNGVFVLLAVALWLLIKLKAGGRALKDIAVVIVTLAVSFSLTILPWAMRNHKAFGRTVFVSTNAGLNMYQALVSAPGKIYEIDPSDPVMIKASTISNEALRNDFYTKSAIGLYKRDPLNALRMLAMRFLFFWSFIDWEVMGGGVINYHLLFIAPFLAAGLYFAHKGKKDIVLISLVLLSFISLILLFPGTARYRLPADSYLIMLGCYGIYEFVRRTDKKRWVLFHVGSYYLFTYLLYRNSVCVKYLIKGLAERLGLW